VHEGKTELAMEAILAKGATQPASAAQELHAALTLLGADAVSASGLMEGLWPWVLSPAVLDLAPPDADALLLGLAPESPDKILPVYCEWLETAMRRLLNHAVKADPASCKALEAVEADFRAKTLRAERAHLAAERRDEWATRLRGMRRELRDKTSLQSVLTDVDLEVLEVEAVGGRDAGEEGSGEVGELSRGNSGFGEPVAMPSSSAAASTARPLGAGVVETKQLNEPLAQV
jgi:hypothetical protein